MNGAAQAPSTPVSFRRSGGSGSASASPRSFDGAGSGAPLSTAPSSSSAAAARSGEELRRLLPRDVLRLRQWSMNRSTPLSTLEALAADDFVKEAQKKFLRMAIAARVQRGEVISEPAAASSPVQVLSSPSTAAESPDMPRPKRRPRIAMDSSDDDGEDGTGHRKNTGTARANAETMNSKQAAQAKARTSHMCALIARAGANDNTKAGPSAVRTKIPPVSLEKRSFKEIEDAYVIESSDDDDGDAFQGGGPISPQVYVASVLEKCRSLSLKIAESSTTAQAALSDEDLRPATGTLSKISLKSYQLEGVAHLLKLYRLG